MNALLLIGAVAAIAWLVFILPVWLGLPSPFTELKRAIRTVGTDSGDVESAAELSNLYEGLRISEVMPSNRSSITDETGGYPDWIEIWNSSDHEINLKGVGLSDDGTSVKFLFPAVTLEADGRVVFRLETRHTETPEVPGLAVARDKRYGRSEVVIYRPA